MALGRKTGGRQKGTPNHITTSIKQAFQEAFEKMGGAAALVAWGVNNQTEFYKLASKLIPIDVKADVKADVTVSELSDTERKARLAALLAKAGAKE